MRLPVDRARRPLELDLISTPERRRPFYRPSALRTMALSNLRQHNERGALDVALL